MKPVLLSCLSAIMLLAACKKNDTPSGPVYTGTILRNICGQVMVQTTGTTLIGQNNWVDGNDPSGKKYDHVFRVQNACQLGNYPEGSNISFRISAPETQNCAVCMLYVATPDTTYPIEVVK